MGGGHRQPYSPSTPSSTWSNSPNGPSTPSSTSPNYFPTLNTPFYPSQSSVAADYPSPHPMSTPPPLYEPVSHGHPTNMMSKEYAPRVYSSTGVVQLVETSYPPSRAPLCSYPQRNLPRVETTTMEYPNSQPSSSSSSSGRDGYQWSRE
jgi:hypothetical protein